MLLRGFSNNCATFIIHIPWYYSTIRTGQTVQFNFFTNTSKNIHRYAVPLDLFLKYSNESTENFAWTLEENVLINFIENIFTTSSKIS